MQKIGFAEALDSIVTSDPRTFNPLLANETSSLDVTDRLYTALADFNNALQQYTPALAKNWDVSADGRTWTWHLRHGARFSDGEPITSADVLFSFRLYSIGAQVLLWATIALIFAPLAERLLAPGAARAPQTEVVTA